MEPRLSVIMPTYQGADWVGTALASLEEAAEDVEVIVLDDRSEDGTADVVRSFDERLPIRFQVRTGERNWVAGTNEGLALARGRYCCFLHQDDFWLPGRFERLRQHLDDDADLVLSASAFADADGRRIGRWRCPLPSGRVEPDVLHERLIVQNFLAIASPVFRTTADLKLDESLWYTADWDFWLRLSRTATRIVYDPRPAVAFRIHGASQTIRRSLEGDAFRSQLETVLERHLRPGLPRSAARAARASLEVNVALAAWAHGGRPGRRLASGLLMPPNAWLRFLRDSRIVERVLPRLAVLRKRL